MLVKQKRIGVFCINVYRLPKLTDDLKRMRAEKEDFKHRLEAAEKIIRESQDTGASGRQAGAKGKDQSSEIHKLKQELESTRRELDETRLRFYVHSFTTFCLEKNNLLLFIN